MPEGIHNRALNYAISIVNNETPANIYVRSVCQSFLNLDSGKYYINEDQLVKLEKFIPYIRGSKDRFKGVPLELLDWQCFLFANVYGVYHKGTDKRRYNNMSVWVARKNGKSTLLSALCLYALVADEWQSAGAEIYCLGVKREQAKIVWQQAVESLKQSRELSARLVAQRDRIIYPKKFGKLEPLSADAKSGDGTSPTLAVCDELAAWDRSDLYDLQVSAVGARYNPLIASISTAGLNPGNFGNQMCDYAKKVALGTIEDEPFFPLVYCVDEGDDPLNDESCWIKANPSLGNTISYEYLRNQLSQARVLESSRINFLVKHSNVFVRGDSFWLNAEKWHDCKEDYNIFDRDDIDAVYLGLDLSSTQDLSSLSGVAITKTGEWLTFCKCYLPEDAINQYAAKGDKRFLDWVRQGYITEIPGAVIDYTTIESDIKSLCDKLPIKEIAYDRWNATSIVNNLADQGVSEMVAFNQSFSGMSGAIGELESRYLSGGLKHDGNPVLTWCMSNVITNQNDNGDVKFSKAKSSNKIDAAVALVMAVGRAAIHIQSDTTPLFFVL